MLQAAIFGQFAPAPDRMEIIVPVWRTGRDSAGPAPVRWRRVRALLGRSPLMVAVASLVAAVLLTTVGVAVAAVLPGPARPAGSGAAAPSPSAAVAARQTARRPAPLRTSCGSVAHIGDSTSVGMVSPAYLPDPALRLQAQYSDVGVRHLLVDASGGRSIVEVLPGQVNGYNVALNWGAHGYHGCWVFALGTNDAANVYAGSNVGLMARIDQMMAAAHGEPVLWVNTHTLLSAGPWSQANMQLWNDDLVRACARYPNMRIFNWAAMDRPAWHIPDGIHYTSAGYAIRARAIAQALARAFPATGRSTSCLVS
jgi:hypothetical protein